MAEGESNASMVEEEGESNDSMVEEEDVYNLSSLYDSEGESNDSMVEEEGVYHIHGPIDSAVSLRTQPNEEVSSPDNNFSLVGTSSVPPDVSFDPTDAEPRILSRDSSAISLHAQPDEVVSFPDNDLPSSANHVVNTSVIAQAVSSDPTDAEPQNLVGDSSGVVPDTSLDDSIRDKPLNDSSSVSLTKKSSNISDEELEKYIDQMPPELKVKPVHCLIICTKEDIEDADKFRKHLITDIKIKNNYPVTAVLDKGPEFSSLDGAVLSHTEECFKRSTFTFIYMTENLLNDKMLLHQIESLVVATLKTKDKKSTIVPVYPRQECTTLDFPYFLTVLKGIEPFKDNEHYRNHLASLIEGKSYVCVKENEELRKKQEEWITQNCQVRLVSIPGLDTDNKKRWHTVGLCLNIVLATALKHVGPLIEKVFKDLKISEQTKDNFVEKHGKTTLSYKAINGNTDREKTEEYDYNIRNAVDFSKCLMRRRALQYTDFNDSCKLETWLYFLEDIDLPSITADCKLSAKKVVEIRNHWAHCNFLEWTDDFYKNALNRIEELLKNLKMKPEEENRFLGDLEETKDHGRNLIHGKTCDLSLLKDLLNKTEGLLKCVTEDEIGTDKIVKIIKSLKSGLDTLMDQLSPK